LALFLATTLLGVPLPAPAAPVSLDALIRSALRDHPDVTAASETAMAQSAQAAAARAPYWPQIGLTSGTSMTTQVSQAQNTVAPFNLSSVGVGARQQVYDFGKTADDVDAADAAALGGREQLAARRIDVAYGVRRAYLEWLRARGMQTQAEVKERAAEALLKQATAFWQVGRRPRLDVTSADASLQQAHAEVIATRNATQVALLALGAAIGRPGPVEAEPSFPAVPALAMAPITELRALAERHPLIRQSAARLRQAEANHRRADKANWPELNADLSFGFRARDLTPNQNWGAGLTLNVPVFNGFADWRQRDATAASARASAADGRSQLLQVTLGIKKAKLATDGGRERLTALAAAVRSAEANLAMAEGRYRAGVGTVIEVNDAQSLLSGARTNQVSAETDYHLAIADLLRAVATTGVDDRMGETHAP
jgi:outer membrane protein TolC